MERLPRSPLRPDPCTHSIGISKCLGFQETAIWQDSRRSEVRFYNSHTLSSFPLRLLCRAARRSLTERELSALLQRPELGSVVFRSETPCPAREPGIEKETSAGQAEQRTALVVMTTED